MPASFAIKMMSQNTAANLLRSFFSEPFVDRRGRLHGNVTALWHLLTFRRSPSHPSLFNVS